MKGYRCLVAAILTSAPTVMFAQRELIPAQIRQRAGCYALTLGPWSGTFPSSAGAAFTPPPQFRLDTTALPPRRGPGYAVEPENLVPSTRPLTGWRPMNGDTLHITWSTGFVGVRLRVAPRGDSLIGTATTFRDEFRVGEPAPPTATVVAVRMTCATQ